MRQRSITAEAPHFEKQHRQTQTKYGTESNIVRKYMTKKEKNMYTLNQSLGNQMASPDDAEGI